MKPVRGTRARDAPRNRRAPQRSREERGSARGALEAICESALGRHVQRVDACAQRARLKRGRARLKRGRVRLKRGR
eukprot:4821651-Pleurochrysis_carterae.AAC.1